MNVEASPLFLTHPLVLSYSSNLFSSIYECKTQIIVWGVMLMMKGAGQTRNSETKLIHNKTQARHLPTSSRRKWLIQLKTLALGFSIFYFLYFIFFLVMFWSFSPLGVSIWCEWWWTVCWLEHWFGFSIVLRPRSQWTIDWGHGLRLYVVLSRQMWRNKCYLFLCPHW